MGAPVQFPTIPENTFLPEKKIKQRGSKEFFGLRKTAGAVTGLRLETCKFRNSKFEKKEKRAD